MNRTIRTRILYCIDNLARGGTELQLTTLIGQLDRQRYQPYLLTIRASDPELEPDDCTCLRWEVPHLFSPAGLRAVGRLRRWLKDEQIDVVQTFFQDATLLGGVAARMANVPVRIASFRDMGFWQTRPQMMALRAVYPMFTDMIANSGMVRDHFVATAGIHPERTVVIHNGLDISALPFVDHEPPVLDVGIVGNLNRPVKRTDLFIRAAGRLGAEFPAVRWHIIGDGSLRGEYERLSRDVGIGDRVIFAGRLDDVAAYIGELAIGVNCSDSEGFSNAIIEYMARGCAVVATDVGGNAEAIEDGITGLLVPTDDEEALAFALRRLISDDRLRRCLASSARKRIEEHFNWQRCVQAHEAVYAGPTTQHRD